MNATTTDARKVEICDECSTAFYDEVPGLLQGPDDIAELLELGSDIGDHRCEYFDDRDVVCDCRCHRGPRSYAK